MLILKMGYYIVYDTPVAYWQVGRNIQNLTVNLAAPPAVAVTKVMPKLVALVFQGVKGLVFDPPTRPPGTHQGYQLPNTMNVLASGQTMID
jgi:hypothetical protein